MQSTIPESPVSRPMSDAHFRMMAFSMRLRNVFRPRRIVLEEAHILPGFRVLDYGCGPGSYIPDASKRTGEAGKVYALDMHPLSIRQVAAIAKAQHLTNVEIIHSDCQTGLPAESIDVVLLYDVFHTLADPRGVLAELHRVLKPDGHLSFSDHHMKHDDIITGLSRSDLFRLSRQGEHTYCFMKCT